MNKIEKLNNTYTLTTENGETFTCTRWFEKKTNQWHILIPKDARKLCGRTYIRENHFDNSTIYEFETKTEHREGMSYGSWKDRMTDEEKVQWTECEKLMETIKQNCLERKPKELTEEEKLQLQIDKLMKKLNSMKKD